MRRVAGRLRLDLAQFRELEAFAAFASDLDRASRAQLERGARLVELLKQPNYSPYTIEAEVIAVWLGTSGSLDDIPVSDVRRFEQEFLENLRHSRKDMLAAIADGTWDDDITAQLDAAVAEFKQEFLDSSEVGPATAEVGADSEATQVVATEAGSSETGQGQ